MEMGLGLALEVVETEVPQQWNTLNLARCLRSKASGELNCPNGPTALLLDIWRYLRMYSYVVTPKKEMYTWKRQRCSRSPAVIAARIPKELTTARNTVSLIGNTTTERKLDCSSEVAVLLKCSRNDSHLESAWYSTSSAIHTATTIKEAATAETTHTTNAA
jgi:hypothetical protein